MSTEENNNKETKPSFNLPKLDDVKNIFNKVHDFDLRQKIRDTREKVNEEIENHPALALVSKIHAPKKWAKDLDDTIYGFSEQFNKDDVYLSSLCRTHEDLIIGSITFSNFIVLRKFLPNRFLFPTVILAGLTTKAFTSIVNYKWDYPRN